VALMKRCYGLQHIMLNLNQFLSGKAFLKMGFTTFGEGAH